MCNGTLRNYHTHTWRCGHAQGDVHDYCHHARKHGVGVIGMADHTPFPDNRWLFRRMRYDQLGEYMAAIDNARHRYTDVLVLKSMECDYVKEFEGFYNDELLGECACDYLIGSVHWFRTPAGWVEVPDACPDREHLWAYTDQYVAAIGFDRFLFMAHPDIFGMFYSCWDEEAVSCSKAILSAAEARDIPLEINSHGLRKSYIRTASGERPKYPIAPFWRLAAEYSIKVVVSSDAHRPEDLTAGISECVEMAMKNGLNLADFGFLEHGYSKSI